MNKIVCIIGPTASGKTGLAVKLAKKFSGELVSADSRQVYRGLNIGTGKEGDPKNNWAIDGIPQYLIDIRELGQQYNLAQFLQDAKKCLTDIWRRGKLPIVVGGTGLYVTALTEGYCLPQIRNSKFEIRNKSQILNSKSQKEKPNFEALLIGIDLPREELYRKIDERVDRRVKFGMIEEVCDLLRAGVDPDWLDQLGLEYRYISRFLLEISPHYRNANFSSLGSKNLACCHSERSEESHQNKRSFVATAPQDDRQGTSVGTQDDRIVCQEMQKMLQSLKYAIHNFAKRQLTWWRHHGEVRWIKTPGDAGKIVKNFLSTMTS